MKILSLRALNINSLYGKTYIDFRTFLEQNTLFAIVGPTGAGKSTLLDIITCALYGRTARLRNPNDLMSRNTTQCLCEVEFEIKGKVFRSSWSQKRARKDPLGKFQNAKMELADLQTQKIIKETVRDVIEYVEELSGLDFEKFTQSMMLAQGSFDAFLKAKESQRSMLLEKITGTQIYAKISKEVYEEYKNTQREIDTSNQILEAIDILTPAEHEHYTTLLKTHQCKKEELQEIIANLELQKTWQETFENLQKELMLYEKSYKKSLAEKEENKSLFKQLHMATKALNCEAIYNKKSRLTLQIEEQATLLKKILEESKITDEEIKQKTAAFMLCEQKYTQEKKIFKIQSAQIQKVQIIEGKIELHKKQLAQTLESTLQTIEGENFLDTYLVQEQQKIEKQQKQLALQETQYSKIEENEELSLSLGKDYPQSIQDIQKLQEAYKEHTKTQEKFLEKKNLLQDLEKECEKIESLRSEKKAIIAQIQSHQSTLYQQKETELLIAKYEQDREKLQPNQECFLCGSQSHPYIDHHIPLNHDTTTKKIEQQEKMLKQETILLQEYDISLTKKNTLFETTSQDIEELKEKKESLEQLFFEENFDYTQDSCSILEQQKLFLAEKIEYDQQKHLEKEALYRSKERLEKSCHQAQIQKDYIENSIEQLQVLQEESKVIRNNIMMLELNKGILLSVGEITQFSQEIYNRFIAIEKEYYQLEKELFIQNAHKKSLQNQYEKLLYKQEKEMSDAVRIENELKNILHANDFKNSQEFEHAFIPHLQRAKIASMCEKIEQRYLHAKTLFINTQNAFLEHRNQKGDIQNKKDIILLLNNYKDTLSQTERNIGAVSQILQRDTLDHQTYDTKQAEMIEQQKNFEVLIKLNEMIGSADGNKFAKFAQGITLDQLIQLANKHLAVLSERYELQRNAHNKHLDIEVIDLFQSNTIRSVNTLSGGESFIVSLSLALGLSELASQKISIDSLFLDEGFGTLDEESLEIAMHALSLLKDSGKMVGVISHVEALKERIPLQIKVVPKGNGVSYLEYE